jgi:hypothetical protein
LVSEIGKAIKVAPEGTLVAAEGGGEARRVGPLKKLVLGVEKSPPTFACRTYTGVI